MKIEQQDEELFQEFIGELQSEHEYRFSSPWRPKGSLSVVVPIILVSEAGKTRKYITLQETEDLTITDSGSIGGVNVKNNGQVPVFVKIGSILKGFGTQSRAVNKSLFIEAGEGVDISVNCVHASHRIRRGSSFSSGPELASPASIEAALLKSEQHEVWRRVSYYSRLRSKTGRSSRGNERFSGYNDNLVGELSLDDTFAKIIKEVTREVPTHEGQVGIGVLDENGVYGLEMFDSPESWKALNKGIVSKFGEAMARKVDEEIIDVKVNPEKVRARILRFLSMLQETPHFSQGGNNDTIIRIHDGKAYGELVFYRGEFVHFTAIRDDDTMLKSTTDGPYTKLQQAAQRR